MTLSPYLVTVIALVVAGVAVVLTRRRELLQRWTTWALIAPVVAGALWFGEWGAASLAAALGVVAVTEYAALTDLPVVDRALLAVCAVAAPIVAVLDPSLLAYAPLVALATAIPALVQGDSRDGARRAMASAFAVVWICWTLAHLVLLGIDAYPVLLATATADVAAWCGGRGLRRFRIASTGLSPLSPNKTWGGVVGASVGASLLLALIGHLSLGLVVAVALGGTAGDLLESMVKREAGVKDAGTWLPGFGGLLDRIDSVLVVLPLALVLT